MMYTAICPKCGSRDIVRINGYTESYGAGNNIKIGLLSRINVNRYICCSCGYTEEWIDPQSIAKLRSSKKAMPVTAQPKNGIF